MKTIFEAFGGTYRQAGGYMLPDIQCPQNANIGIWGQHRARYLRDEKKVLYRTTKCRTLKMCTAFCDFCS